MYRFLSLAILVTGCANNSNDTTDAGTPSIDAGINGDAGALTCDQQLQVVGDALWQFAAANQNCTIDSGCVAATTLCLGCSIYPINLAAAANATAYSKQLCASVQMGCWRNVFCYNYPNPVCDVDAGVCTPGH